MEREAFMCLKPLEVKEQDSGWYHVWSTQYNATEVPARHKLRPGDCFIPGKIYQKIDNPPTCPQKVVTRR